RGAGGGRAGRPRRAAGRQVLRRHGPPAAHRRRPAQPAPAAGARRTHRGGRPAEPQRHHGKRRAAGRRGHRRALHHPLHGGGRAVVRPGRHPRPGPVARRGHPAGAGRPGRHRRRGGPRRRRRPGGRRAGPGPARPGRPGAGRAEPPAPGGRPGRQAAARAAGGRRDRRDRGALGGGTRTGPGVGVPAPDRQGAAGVTRMRTLALVTAKDLRQQLGNGTLLIFAVVLPLGLALLFHTVFGGVDDEVEATYGVVDLDGGEHARTFTDSVLGAVAESGAFEVRPLDSLSEADAMTEDGELDATFVIPEGFSADVAAGRGATLTVIGHVDSP